LTRPGQLPVVFYVFDVMVLAGKDVTALPLTERQALLKKKILPKLKEPIRYTGTLDARLSDPRDAPVSPVNPAVTTRMQQPA
jgi:ATP-dependent DNA ligase